MNSRSELLLSPESSHCGTRVPIKPTAAVKHRVIVKHPVSPHTLSHHTACLLSHHTARLLSHHTACLTTHPVCLSLSSCSGQCLSPRSSRLKLMFFFCVSCFLWLTLWLQSAACCTTWINVCVCVCVVQVLQDLNCWNHNHTVCRFTALCFTLHILVLWVLLLCVFVRWVFVLCVFVLCVFVLHAPYFLLSY